MNALGLGRQGVEQLVEALREGGDALLLEGGGHVLEVDAELAQRGDDLPGGVRVGVDGAGERAVVVERLRGWRRAAC